MNVPSLESIEVHEWLEKYISERTKKPLGSLGKNAYIIALKWFLARTNLISDVEHKLKGLHRYKIAYTGTTIHESDFEEIMQFCPSTTFELAYRLIYECGFRPHELLSICVKHIKETGPVISSEETKSRCKYAVINLPEKNSYVPSGRNKTGGRTIIVSKKTETLFKRTEEIGKQYGLEGRLFPWAHKTLSVIFSQMKQKFKEEREEQQNAPQFHTAHEMLDIYDQESNLNSFPGRLYDFRHTAITRLYLRNYPDQVVRSLVGWSPSSRMADVYVHIGQDHL